MRDIITLKGLSAHGIHGVYDFEHTVKQLFLVDVALWVDFSTATANDDIAATVSYADIARDVVSIVEGPSVRLIETLAQRIVERVMADPRVEGALVTVHKPQAPMEQEFADVSVSVRRGITDISALDATFPFIEEADVAPVANDAPLAQNASAVRTAALHSAHELSAQGAAPLSLAPSVAGNEETPAHLGEEASQADAKTGVETDAAGCHAAQVGAVSSEQPFVLAFGGNQGDVPVTLVAALELLMKDNFITIDNISPLLRTAAVVKPGMDAQDDHWNMVVVGHTRLTPHQLLDVTSGIEATLGRQRPFDWAPRTIDIDLIRVGDNVISDEVLQLPHPRAYARSFVLVPWLLADPHAELPGYAPLSDLIADAEDRHGIIDVIDQWYLEPGTVMEKSNAVLEALAHGSAEEPTAPVGSDAAQPAAFALEPAPLAPREPESDADVKPASPSVPAAGEEPTERPQAAPRSHFAPPADVPRRPRTRVKTAQRDFAAEWDAFVKTVDFNATAEEAPEPEAPISLPHAGDYADSSSTDLYQTPAWQDVPDPRPTIDESDSRAAMPVSAQEESASPEPRKRGGAPVRALVDDIFALDALAELEAEHSQAAPAEITHEERPRLTHVPSFDEVLESEPTSGIQTHISWIPVSAAIPVITESSTDDLPFDQEFISDRTKATESLTEAEDSRGEDTPTPALSRPLPSWNFSQRVNVIDSIDEADSSAPDAEEDAFAENSGQIVLDPQLPSGMDVGALPQTHVPAANLSRKSVLRPTHTGAIPIVKRRQ